MSLWTHLSQSFWEEAEAPAVRGSHAATGAPASLRSAVRFVVVGFSAIVLTAQVGGIRLTAPVDANPSYCENQWDLCIKTCPGGSDNGDCNKRCHRQLETCRRNEA
jgi:hypothetical protein